MPLTMFEACMPPMVRGLGVLKVVLTKGAAHAAERGLSEAAMLEARLAPDMFNLTRQVQSTSDAAKFAAYRLAGLPPPSFADTEASFAELLTRIGRTTQLLEQFTPSQFEGSEARAITIGSGAGQRSFDGRSYLLGFALPNFFFHLTTAYDVLRHQGVSLGKRDFLGPVGV